MCYCRYGGRTLTRQRHVHSDAAGRRFALRVVGIYVARRRNAFERNVTHVSDIDVYCICVCLCFDVLLLVDL